MWDDVCNGVQEGLVCCVGRLWLLSYLNFHQKQHLSTFQRESTDGIFAEVNVVVQVCVGRVLGGVPGGRLA